MLTSDERRALVFLAVVAAAGAAFRAARTAPAAGEAVPAVAPGLAGADIQQQAARSKRAESLARPLAADERVDVDRASADELQRLPRVGAALARRIVAEREAHGPFGTLAGLQRVTGLGPRVLRDLEPHVSFGGLIPAAAAAPAGPGAAPPFAYVASGAQAALPARNRTGRELVWVAPAAASPPAPSASAGCAHPPDLNHATVAELLCLPGIGNVLAQRLVAEREAHGPFRDLRDLARIKGFSAARIERLRASVTIP